MKFKASLTAALLLMVSTVSADESMKGDAEAGKALYGVCSGCHGVAGEGNAALMAPRLAGQFDWYTVTQLMNFRSGVRGAAEGDTAGSTMRAMASVLPDDQAVKDVSAYIATLP